MSRTINTMPWQVVAVDVAAIDHTCTDPTDCPFSRDRWNRPPGTADCWARFDDPAIAHHGGTRAGQSGWATLLDRTRRSRLRGQLHAAVRAANSTADPDDLWDIDVADRRRGNVSWYLW